MKIETLIEENGFITHAIETEENKHSSLSFWVYEIIAWDINNKPTESEIYISGSIKWDGCSNIIFGGEDGCLHLCGNKYFQDLKKVLDAVWAKAEKEIETFDKNIAY